MTAPNASSDLPGGGLTLPCPIWFVRHGRTEWNAAGRFQGLTDIPLYGHGQAQARRNGRALAASLEGRNAPVRHVASPLGRARETMALIREAMGLPQDGYEIDPRLVEIDFGDWNGHTKEEIAAAAPALWAARQRDFWSVTPPGGESFERAALRVRGFLSAIDEPTLIAGHGGTGRLIRAYARGLRRADIMALANPQDVVFAIEDGSERTI